MSMRRMRIVAKPNLGARGPAAAAKKHDTPVTKPPKTSHSDTSDSKISTSTRVKANSGSQPDSNTGGKRTRQPSGSKPDKDSTEPPARSRRISGSHVDEVHSPGRARRLSGTQGDETKRRRQASGSRCRHDSGTRAGGAENTTPSSITLGAKSDFAKALSLSEQTSEALRCSAPLDDGAVTGAIDAADNNETAKEVERTEAKAEHETSAASQAVAVTDATPSDKPKAMRRKTFRPAPKLKTSRPAIKSAAKEMQKDELSSPSLDACATVVEKPSGEQLSVQERKTVASPTKASSESNTTSAVTDDNQVQPQQPFSASSDKEGSRQEVSSADTIDGGSFTSLRKRRKSVSISEQVIITEIPVTTAVDEPSADKSATQDDDSTMGDGSRNGNVSVTKLTSPRCSSVKPRPTVIVRTPADNKTDDRELPADMAAYVETTKPETQRTKALLDDDSVTTDDEADSTRDAESAVCSEGIFSTNNEENIEDGQEGKETKKMKKRNVRRTKQLADKVDRFKMTIGELIFSNPASNPMKSNDKTQAGKAVQQPPSDQRSSRAGSPVSSRAESNVSDDHSLADSAALSLKTESKVDSTQSDTGGGGAIQMKIGPDGQLVIDEASLVVRAPEQVMNHEDKDIVYEDQNNVSVSWAYKRTGSRNTWGPAETKKFYMALSAVGTDFSLMTKILPNRSRLEIKRKFKKEEKINGDLIDNAIREKQYFDLNFFENIKNMELEEEKKEEKPPKKRGRKVKVKDEEGGGNGDDGSPTVKRRRKKVQVKEEDGGEGTHVAGMEKRIKKETTKKAARPKQQKQSTSRKQYKSRSVISTESDYSEEPTMDLDDKSDVDTQTNRSGSEDEEPVKEHSGRTVKPPATSNIDLLSSVTGSPRKRGRKDGLMSSKEVCKLLSQNPELFNSDKDIPDSVAEEVKRQSSQICAATTLATMSAKSFPGYWSETLEQEKRQRTISEKSESAHVVDRTVESGILSDEVESDAETRATVDSRVSGTEHHSTTDTPMFISVTVPVNNSYTSPKSQPVRDNGTDQEQDTPSCDWTQLSVLDATTPSCNVPLSCVAAGSPPAETFTPIMRVQSPPRPPTVTKTSRAMPVVDHDDRTLNASSSFPHTASSSTAASTLPHLSLTLPPTTGQSTTVTVHCTPTKHQQPADKCASDQRVFPGYDIGNCAASKPKSSSSAAKNTSKSGRHATSTPVASSSRISQSTEHGSKSNSTTTPSVVHSNLQPSSDVISATLVNSTPGNVLPDDSRTSSTVTVPLQSFSSPTLAKSRSCDAPAQSSRRSVYLNEDGTFSVLSDDDSDEESDDEPVVYIEPENFKHIIQQQSAAPAVQQAVVQPVPAARRAALADEAGTSDGSIGRRLEGEDEVQAPRGFLAPEGITIAHPDPPTATTSGDDATEIIITFAENT